MNMTSDFWRLSDPGQFICRFPEQITRRLVGKTAGKEYFEFVHPELAESEGIAPGSAGWFIVSLDDRDVIANDKVGERTILPIRWVHILVGGDVVGRTLREEREAFGKPSRKENGIGYIARRYHRRSDSTDMFMFPGELLLQARRV